MNDFVTHVQVRWSDLDPNFHLRHSVYYDWGALCRINFFYKFGLTSSLMQQFHLGPILFREECIFKKEIHLQDTVMIDLILKKGNRDISRWSIQHRVLKNDNILSAIITVDGAWIDTSKRKLTVPPDQAIAVFEQMPKGADFVWS
ncbi:MAG: acyl-CoA thioesterase [Chitinophagaceae bacterium]|jgi:acyl-CoA thioester hydrolase|nr:acyl-CoA thioesterase [Chitinophagaceae bacterium]